MDRIELTELVSELKILLVINRKILQRFSQHMHTVLNLAREIYLARSPIPEGLF